MLFAFVFIFYVSLLTISILYTEDSALKCSESGGLYIRIAGTVLGCLFLATGIKVYKKFSIKKSNMLSLLTME